MTQGLLPLGAVSQLYGKRGYEQKLTNLPLKTLMLANTQYCLTPRRMRGILLTPSRALTQVRTSLAGYQEALKVATRGDISRHFCEQRTLVHVGVGTIGITDVIRKFCQACSSTPVRCLLELAGWVSEGSHMPCTEKCGEESGSFDSFQITWLHLLSLDSEISGNMSNQHNFVYCFLIISVSVKSSNKN